LEKLQFYLPGNVGLCYTEDLCKNKTKFRVGRFLWKGDNCTAVKQFV